MGSARVVIDLLGVVTATPSPTPSPALPHVLQRFEPTLHHFGYGAVALALFIENMGIPLPGQLVLIAAAVYAGTGSLNIVAVGIVGLVATIAGSGIGYVIGVYGGRPLVERYGKYVLLTADRLDKAEAFFNKRGWLVLLVGRFIDGVRQAMGILAGISDMTFRRFAMFTSLGAVIWVGFWTVLSDAAGNHITTIIKYAGYFAAAVAVVLVVLIVRMIVKARRRTALLQQSSQAPRG
jgi:membrane protein DedA with SNARE-associated domain